MTAIVPFSVPLASPLGTAAGPIDRRDGFLGRGRAVAEAIGIPPPVVDGGISVAQGGGHGVTVGGLG